MTDEPLIIFAGKAKDSPHRVGFESGVGTSIVAIDHFPPYLNHC